MTQTQSKLENITSISFPANHLLQFSIVKQVSEQSYKKQFFFFITLAPGVANPQGGRTFDFNNRVTMKVESYQIKELSHALRAYSRGQETTFGPFTIYVDTGKSQYGQPGGGQGKSLMLQKTQTQQKGNTPSAPAVTFFFKAGTNQALGYSMTPYRALAIADELEELSKHCGELERARGSASTHTGSYDNPNFAEPVPGSGPTSFTTPPSSPQPFNASPNNVASNFAGTFNTFQNDDVPF